MAKRIPAGELRQLVEVQRDIGELDSYGQISHEWITDFELRAKIEILRGREGELARQLYPHAEYKVSMEYHPDLYASGATQRRLLFGERILHIGAVLNPDEENVMLELLCGEER